MAITFNIMQPQHALVVRREDGYHFPDGDACVGIRLGTPLCHKHFSGRQVLIIQRYIQWLVVTEVDQHRIHGHAVQPCTETGIAFISGDLPEHLKKNVMRKVFG